MATVRLNDELIKCIKDASRRMYAKQIEEIGHLPVVCSTGNVYQTWLDSDVGLRADIAVAQRRSWTVEVTTIHVTHLNGVRTDFMTPQGGMPVSVPGTVAYNTGLSFRGPGAEEILTAWEDWKQTREFVVTQRNEFMANVEALLKRHSTLKQAMTEWPALWDLLPLETKERYNEEKARPKREKPVDERPPVNLDVLNGAVVAQRLLKGD